jgi:hypothetical protein
MQGVQNTTPFAVNLDNALDFIPVVSTVSNLFHLFEKAVLACRSDSSDLKSRYYTHIQEKSALKCAILLIPVIGNLLAYLLRNSYLKPTQQVKVLSTEAPASNPIQQAPPIQRPSPNTSPINTTADERPASPLPLTATPVAAEEEIFPPAIVSQINTTTHIVPSGTRATANFLAPHELGLSALFSFGRAYPSQLTAQPPFLYAAGGAGRQFHPIEQTPVIKYQFPREFFVSLFQDYLILKPAKQLAITNTVQTFILKNSSSQEIATVHVPACPGANVTMAINDTQQFWELAGNLVSPTPFKDEGTSSLPLNQEQAEALGNRRKQAILATGGALLVGFFGVPAAFAAGLSYLTAYSALKLGDLAVVKVQKTLGLKKERQSLQ